MGEIPPKLSRILNCLTSYVPIGLNSLSIMKFGADKTIAETAEVDEVAVHGAPLENPEKGRWERSWPTIACGAGLFSDGYLNGYGCICAHLLPGQIH